jgi:pyruvate/2-oxoglutarate dehydrogenase complex dihydrolipoamide acyltransferase (E2) component
MSDSHIQLTGRDGKINAAMQAFARNFTEAYSREKITNGEAAAWLNNNRDKLYMFHLHPSWRRKFLIEGLNEEIEDVGNTGAISLVEINEVIKILSEQAPAAAPASEQMPAAAPASKQTPATEPPGKQEATRELTILIDKLIGNNLALHAKAKHHLLFLSSEEQPPEKKRNEAKYLTEIMIKHVNDRADRLRAMYYISILRGNEGGYRRRTKNSKHRRSKKSRKTKSRRH